MALVRTRVKFCGMTNLEDIGHAIDLGVDALGLILFKGSKRYVDLAKARELAASIPAFVDVVAVVVDPEADEVWQMIDNLAIQYIQFHGSESPAFCEQFHFPYIKAVPARNAREINSAIERFHSASAILLDTASGDNFGGSGKSFDWSMIPDAPGKSLIIAGGIGAHNVSSLKREKNPFAIDLCSAIESSYAKKDIHKMKQLINILRTLDGHY